MCLYDKEAYYWPDMVTDINKTCDKTVFIELKRTL